MSTVDHTILGWAARTPIGETVVRTAGRRTLLDVTAAAVFAATVLLVAAWAVVKPDFNWDMVAYIGSAIEDRYDTPEEMHAATWAAIDARADEGQQFHLKQSHPYNLHQWQHPADFQSQLSMYRVKVAYVWLLGALEPVVGAVGAAFLLSVVPSLLLGGFLLWWLWRDQALQGAFLVAPVLMIAGYSAMTSAVSPDLLLTLVSMAALYCLWRGLDWAGAVLLVASVFVRPDNVILIFALLIAAVLFGWRKLPMLVAFVGALAAGSLISRLGDHPGWWAHFYFSTVQMQNSMADFHPAFSLIDFAKGYVRGLTGALQSDWPWLLALMAAGWALLNKYRRIGPGRANGLIFACAIGTLGKFASFPLPDDRFYFVFTVGMAMLLVLAWKPSFGEDRSRG